MKNKVRNRNIPSFEFNLEYSPSSVKRGLVLLSQNGLKFPMRASREWLSNEQRDFLASSTHFLAFSNSSHNGDGTGINFERNFFPQRITSSVYSFLHEATVCSTGGRSSQAIAEIGESQRSFVPCKVCRTTRASASSNTELDSGLTQGSKFVLRHLRQDWDWSLGCKKQTILELRIKRSTSRSSDTSTTLN